MTRWAFVARSLVQGIASGQHPVGSMLPNEFDLADRFGVSRATVRSALQSLQHAGMISRRRNAGTRVEAVLPVNGPQSYNQTLSTIEDVVQYDAQTRRKVCEVVDETADEALAARLGGAPGQRWLRVSSLRLSRGRGAPPLCWTDVYVVAAFAEEVRRRVRAFPGLISTLIEEASGCRTAEIRQSIRAGGIPARLADRLEAAPGAHALDIERRYLDAKGGLIILTRSIHPADRFSYETRLSRQTDAILFGGADDRPAGRR